MIDTNRESGDETLVGKSDMVCALRSALSYRYLMASVAFTAAVVQWMVFQVVQARKAA